MDKALLETGQDWLPNPGPQTQAYFSQADVLFYGGAAGGGKSDLLLGLAHRSHQRSIIFRREFTQLAQLEERAEEMFGRIARYNGQTHVYKLQDGRKIELGAVKDAGDEQKYMGRPHDLKAFDEISHFLEMQFRFLSGWLRTTIIGQRTRVVAGGNPPILADEAGNSDNSQWVINYWGPWLDEQHHNPAMPGELRWFTTTDDNKDFEVDGPGKVTYKGRLYTPKSRTFIPSRVEDNPYYADTGYRDQLASLPEPLRSQLLEGDFRAGRTDSKYQLIPTDWVKAAQQRWRERKEPTDLPIQQVGVDVARGGRDRTVLSPRKGNYFCKQQPHKGITTKDGPAVATLVMQSCNSTTTVAIDIIGVGTSPVDILRTHNFSVMALNASNASEAIDPKSKLFGFINLRAEWWWMLRCDLDPTSGMDLAIPDDPELLADLTAFHYKLTVRGIQLESKDDVYKRIRRSPDKGDSLVYAHCRPTFPGQGVFDYFKAQAEQQEAARKQSGDNRTPKNPPIVLGTAFPIYPQR